MSIWYSVDPLAEKYPNINPYVYCEQNPINLIDPDGRGPILPIPFPVPNVIGLYTSFKLAAKTAYKSTVSAWKKADNYVNGLKSDHPDSGGGGYKLHKDGGTDNKDYEMSRKGFPDGEVNVTAAYLLNDIIGANEKANAFNSAVNSFDKVKAVVEMTKKAKDGIALGGDIVDEITEQLSLKNEEFCISTNTTSGKEYVQRRVTSITDTTIKRKDERQVQRNQARKNAEKRRIQEKRIRS